MCRTKIAERENVCQVVRSTGIVRAVATRKPKAPTWAEIADQLRSESGMSQDDLAYGARQFGAPATLTGSWISQLRKGTRPLTLEILAGIAGALEVPPETFAEYRLAQARRMLDEREEGLDQAIANLSRVESELFPSREPSADERRVLQALRGSAGSRQAARPAKGRERGAA